MRSFLPKLLPAIVALLAFSLGMFLTPKAGPPTPSPAPTPAPLLPLLSGNPDVDEHPATFEASVQAAKAATAVIGNRDAWHATNDAAAIHEFGLRRPSLEFRTRHIRDSGVRDAGHAFLASISAEHHISGQVVYVLDRAKLLNIDPEKLQRWAAIALTILEIVEPFVPPPYDVAVHAAVMLLKLYLAQNQPTPAMIFGQE